MTNSDKPMASLKCSLARAFEQRANWSPQIAARWVSAFSASQIGFEVINDYPDDCWIELKRQEETYLVYVFFPFLITNSKKPISMKDNVVCFAEHDWRSAHHNLTMADLTKFFGITDFSSNISCGMVCIQDLIVNTAIDAIEPD